MTPQERTDHNVRQIVYHIRWMGSDYTQSIHDSFKDGDPEDEGWAPDTTESEIQELLAKHSQLFDRLVHEFDNYESTQAGVIASLIGLHA